eukprot:14776867-Ditylum_brightwellii.AAC.1
MKGLQESKKGLLAMWNVFKVNNLNFGWGGDLSYNDCHRGVSIFCAAQKSKTETARLEKKRERLERATYISPSGIAELNAALS